MYAYAFSDASRPGYAEAVHPRILNEDGSVNINLVSAITKAAPYSTTVLTWLKDVAKYCTIFVSNGASEAIII